MASKPEKPLPLDSLRLISDCDDEQSYVNRCLHLFVRDAQEDLNGISAAFEQNDLSQIARLAHRIKGASASIRAEFLRQQAALLEALGSREEWTAANETFVRLQAEFEHFKNYIDTLPRDRD